MRGHLPKHQGAGSCLIEGQIATNSPPFDAALSLAAMAGATDPNEHRASPSAGCERLPNNLPTQGATAETAEGSSKVLLMTSTAAISSGSEPALAAQRCYPIDLIVGAVKGPFISN